MSDKEPGTREHPLQFLAVDLSLTKISRLTCPAATSTRPPRYPAVRSLAIAPSSESGLIMHLFDAMSPCLAAGRQLARPLRRHRQDLARIARRRRPRQRTTRPPLISL